MPQARTARDEEGAADQFVRPTLVTTNRHDEAVANSLAAADEAASQHDFRAALSWLTMLEAIGDELPVAYHSKREDWTAMLEAGAGIETNHAARVDTLPESLAGPTITRDGEQRR